MVSRIMKNLFAVLLLSVISISASTRSEKIRESRHTYAKDRICILPSYPKNGHYSVVGSPNAKPGDEFNSIQIQFSCHSGYQPLGNTTALCVFGDWSGDIPRCVRHCKLTPHPSVKYRCQVSRGDTGESYYRDCEEYEPTGTIVRPKCNEPNYYYTGLLSLMTCVEGRWNYIAICQPQCGTVTPDGKALIVGGRQTERGEFPWHAGIYRKDISPYKLICGGSLVSSTVIISAAHCFWNRVENKLRPKTSYSVALGKFYREWDNALDIDVQKFDVVDIKVPARYQDGYSSFQDDVAIVWLSVPAVFNPFVRPVCIDFDPEFDANQLREGSFGKVAGWGISDLEGTPSPVLKVIELPYVGIERCINEAPATFRPFITSDKICAGYTNGSAVCQGDSGGGLVFNATIRATSRYYLRGIVSTAPESQYACNAYERTTFTKISKHREFIEKNTVLFEQTTFTHPVSDSNTDLDQRLPTQTESEALCILPPYPDNGNYSVIGQPNALPGERLKSAQLNITCYIQFELDKKISPSCTNGIWSEEMPNCIIEIQCGRVINRPPRVKRVAGGEPSQRGEIPWSTGIYTKTSNPYKLICGGSIIRTFLVISAARCFWDDKKGAKIPEKNFAVAAGKLFSPWSNAADTDAQKSDISEIRTPNYFRGEETNFQDNIALLKLVTPVTYSDYVKPVCLDFDQDFRRHHLSEDRPVKSNLHILISLDGLGAVVDYEYFDDKIAGWGQASSDNEPANELNIVELPYVKSDMCLGTYPIPLRRYYTSDKICAGYINGTKTVCTFDSGAGMVANEPDYSSRIPFNAGRFYLRGIVSYNPKDGDPCLQSYAIFTDISAHEYFIKSFPGF